jgi:cytochrome c oxidase subunit II
MMQPQSALDPAGAGSEAVATLWWIMFALGTLVFVAVVAATGWAIARHRRRAREAEPLAFARRVDPVADRRARRVVTLAAVATVVILTVTFALSLGTSRANARLADDGGAEIEIVGVQWWWEVRYLDSLPARVVRTANELHLPAGRSVRLKLRSRDVIHSFWAPNLHGKMDLIPGRENSIWVRAERPGRYRAQCAEFCGLQHTKMALAVVVHEASEYDAWLTALREPLAAPTDSLERAGAEAFARLACATCHTIRGTEALGQAGPDLTHFGRRLTIAAGDLPNSPANLAAWLSSPQAIKPGTHMPDVALSAPELVSLVAYLSSQR